MTKIGDRIEVVSLDDPFTKLRPGSRGTVTDIKDIDLGGDDRFTQVSVKWDSGETLMLATPPDRYKVI